jgi:transcription-repair coupling factor (superfamily II helicase)
MRLASHAETDQGFGLYVASSERRADELGRALRRLSPDVDVLVFPPWDCLPYDRASPSRESMGRRMAVLARIAEYRGGPCVLVTSPEALLQRVPSAKGIESGFRTLRTGDRITRDEIAAFADAAGYTCDDRVDEPGEISILGEVIDIFPAAAEAPVRITLKEDAVIAEMRRFEPVSQRTEDDVHELVIGPASELVLSPDDPGESLAVREEGMEHRAPLLGAELRDVLTVLPDGWLALDSLARTRCAEVLEGVEEAYESQRSLGSAGEGTILAPDRLYLTADEVEAGLASRPEVDLGLGGLEAPPKFARQAGPAAAFARFVGERLDEGMRVVVAGMPQELRPLRRALKRGLDRVPTPIEDWIDIKADRAPDLLQFELDVDEGFIDRDGGLLLVAASDVLGGRVAVAGQEDTSRLLADPDLRVGDVVIHEDHGIGVLRALERVEVADLTCDAVRIEYHGGHSILAPVEEFGRIWRYSAEEEAVSLDRLHTDAWSKRRIALSAEIDRTAEHLVEVARERAETPGFVAEPSRAAMNRFAARFRYPETPDQSAAIAAVLEDLSSGRRMNRLVCGDVGFGKTEVALRAAAAVALSGKQVAVIAPTTVLARQHFLNFKRRFSGTDIEVAHLSRLVSGADAKAVRERLADGSIDIVVGTHAVAGKSVSFHDLALLVIDEEQKFGAAMKQSIRSLAPDAHLLTMTATPIPRTLQLAMIGIEDVSVIATPPARRRPIRTFLAPFDPATTRTALLREKRRGGQSFVVVPRIEDIADLQARLAELAPELDLRVAHGEMPGDEMDEVMVDFADGRGDVLLATNIIESGLDVPRANTMLVWRADLFGLAQLHQLRGRVGRGRSQGVAYLLTDPDAELPDATRARLSTLVAHDRLGAGLAISTRDLDMRGAGDLLGEDQAGHVKTVGTALYQRLLARAVLVARGEISGPDWTPELHLSSRGSLPESYIPDATLRLNLYARLARLQDVSEVEAFAEELEDRFGPPPDEAVALLDLAGIRTAALRAGIARIDLGPKAAAFAFRAGGEPKGFKPPKGTMLKDGRLIWPSENGQEHALAAIRRLLDRLAG